MSGVKTPSAARPPLEHGQQIVVREAGIREWSGVVVAVKPSPKGWRVEVRDERGDWSVPAEHVRA